jgi:hypothetical protein
VGIVNANLSEGAVIYIKGNPQNPPTCCSNADGNLSGFNYDGEQFTTLPFRAAFVTYFKDGYREYRNSDGSGNWTGPTSFYGLYASNSSNTNTREVAIPWSAITGGGIPSSFVFFGFLTSSGGYVYGQAPPDNPGTFVGTNATATQYYAVVNTGNGTSTPPFSLEQPGGFSSFDISGFLHNTFNPFYRDQEGAVPENTPVTLRFRALSASAISNLTVRAYIFDTASSNTTGPVDTPMTADAGISINGTDYDVWKVTLTMPSSTSVYYYKFKINRDTTQGFYSDDYLDDNDNLNKDGTGTTTTGEPFNSFQITVYDPNFQTPAWLQNGNVYHIMPDRFRNGDQTNDYCRTGSTTGCPTFYGGGPTNTVIHYDTWNTQMCDPRNPVSSCYNNFTQFYNGDLAGVLAELDYIQSLGFDTIYMNPIFMARSYHRYDTDQYLHIDPGVGRRCSVYGAGDRTEQTRYVGDSRRCIQSRVVRRPLLRSLRSLRRNASQRRRLFVAVLHVSQLVPLQQTCLAPPTTTPAGTDSAVCPPSTTPIPPSRCSSIRAPATSPDIGTARE